MIAPTDAQWDSPYVVTLNRVPNVDMTLKYVICNCLSSDGSVYILTTSHIMHHTHKTLTEILLQGCMSISETHTAMKRRSLRLTKDSLPS
jgi:hypothetical protein